MISNRSLAEQTKANYVKGITDFCNYFGSTPKQLIEQFKGLNEDEIVQKFAEYFADAKDRLAPKSMWGWLPAIKAWLLENSVKAIDRISREIAREFRRKFGSPKPLLKRDILTKEDIIKILNVADLREKAIICTLASGGFRLSTAINLQLKHLENIEEDKDCYMVEVPEEITKEREPYVTFISREARDYIRELLLLRSAKGEQIIPEFYLFTTHRGNKQLSAKRFDNTWRELCKKAGIDLKPIIIKGKHPINKRNGKVVYEEKPKRYNTRIHALRKFFKTSCSVAGVDRMASEAFLGHSLASFGMESVYDFCISRREWLREQYLKVLPLVTFLKPIEAKSKDAIILDLQKQIKDLQEQLAGTISMYRQLEQKFKELSGKISEYSQL
jgi:integrase